MKLAQNVDVRAADGSRVYTAHKDEAIRLVRSGQATKLDKKNIVLMFSIKYEIVGKPSEITLSRLRGTKYSFRQMLPSGHTCHDLRRLSGARGGVNYAPSELRPIFLEVLTSCLTDEASKNQQMRRAIPRVA